MSVSTCGHERYLLYARRHGHETGVWCKRRPLDLGDTRADSRDKLDLFDILERDQRKKTHKSTASEVTSGGGTTDDSSADESSENESLVDDSSADDCSADESSAGESTHIISQNTAEEIDLELKKAFSLLICHQAPVSAAEICTHWRTDHPGLKWNDKWPLPTMSFLDDLDESSVPWPWVSALRNGTSCAKQAIAALAFPEDTPYAELDRMVRSGRLVCLCGSPELPPPSELIRGMHHAIKERDLSRRMSTRGSQGTALGTVFIDTHMLSRPKILAKGEEAVYPDYGLDDDTTAVFADLLAANSRSPICVLCEGTAKRESYSVEFDLYV
ncbi:hypothetical protein BD413DRAFT_301806 [Trametes elegans]|nr:hypothetical protein BD413DRAFT_301806 [Trametes elegans]